MKWSNCNTWYHGDARLSLIIIRRGCHFGVAKIASLKRYIMNIYKLCVTVFL